MSSEATNWNPLGSHQDSNSGMYMGLSHTTKWRSLPACAPAEELDTFARVLDIARTKRNIAGTVCAMVTWKGVIPAVLIAFATTTRG